MRKGMLLAALGVALMGSLAGCQKAAPPPVMFHWWAGHAMPAFDPDGPPDPLRQSLERLLTRSLVTVDSLGRPVLDAADSLAISEDGRSYTFRIRAGLRYTDGRACRSDDFRDGLLAGLGREDQATRAWALAAVRGVDRVRPRRRLPPIGIEAPDSLTLVLHLARPDSLLLDKLGMPGASEAWESREDGTGWGEAVGLGPYRVRKAEAHRLVLARVEGAGPDSVFVRFGSGVARARSALRVGRFDLLWPLPPAMLDQPLGDEYVTRSQPADPPRRLSLVFRADVPPTTRLAARRALAYGIARSEVTRRLGEGAREIEEWIPGAGAAELPGFDPAEVLAWLDRGKLGRSFRVRLAYDADGAGAALARSLEGEWARAGLSTEMRPLRGEEFSREALHGLSQALLVEEQGLIAGPLGILAPAVMPLRGPAVGGFRVGWRTREFDGWLLARQGPSTLRPEYAERRLEEETDIVPLCSLDWVWIERSEGARVAVDPRCGPGPAGAVKIAEPVPWVVDPAPGVSYPHVAPTPCEGLKPRLP